jgi:predicted acyltransferase
MPQTTTNPAPEIASSSTAAGNRLVSLDAFRGATMALMVLVNNSGGPSYKQLQHSSWNGWTITDTVFPTFLWIVGVAITLSLGKRLANGVPRSKLIGPTFRRAIILYVLGLLVYVYPAFNLSTQRWMGVLQRIAICYLIASLIYLYTSIRGQLAWIVGLMAAYWLLMAFAPVPGYGSGRLDIPGNFAHYVDQIVLGHHNYAETKTWDPEGIVSTLPAIATTLLGIMAGHILRRKTSLGDRTIWLFVTGNLLIPAGLILDIWLPINKKLWTDSFSIFMAGLDFVILALCIWFIDERGNRRIVKPLVILGMNAIVVYMASEIFAEVLDSVHWHAGGHTISVQDWFAHLAIASPMNLSLLYAICYVLLMYVIAYVLYRRGWFLRI